MRPSLLYTISSGLFVSLIVLGIVHSHSDLRGSHWREWYLDEEMRYIIASCQANVLIYGNARAYIAYLGSSNILMDLLATSLVSTSSVKERARWAALVARGSRPRFSPPLNHSIVIKIGHRTLEDISRTKRTSTASYDAIDQDVEAW
ncbi:hypothetical protein DEU56DRAFT_800596 [Suillus clintonianus]|uniref:uncharacterized protein n=1 Tax=Suillus clintonianus TaxID=1904413 RepID=UPI001B860C23|nr:uncharacterized protein DEU56DRAFT_800596 [Suillus clintonianus]KAG2139304.1 hypothetical protein DEU56DRAFT_800596 [Suillus clintonianus]